jgi:hypothetical protein
METGDGGAQIPSRRGPGMKKLFFFSLLKSVILLVLMKRLSFTEIFAANTLLTFLGTWAFFRKTDENQQRPLSVILELLAPIFSTVALFAYGIFAIILKKYEVEEDDFDHRLPFGEEHYKDFLDSRQDELIIENFEDHGERKLHESFQIEPFLDIIEGTDIDLKINAIGKLSAVPAKPSIALLKLALNDPSYEVKYFASNSLSLLERQLVGKIEILSQNIERFPENHGNYTQRGLSYLNMYYLGIIDPGVADIFLERALNDFLYSLQIDSTQNYLYVKVLEVYTYRRDHGQILELEPLLSEMNFPEEDLVKIRFYVAEALYRTGQYEKLISCVRPLRDSSYLADLMTEPVNYWAEIKS